MKHGIFQLFSFILLVKSFAMDPEIILVVSFLSLVAGSADTDRSGAKTGMELYYYPRNGFMCKTICATIVKTSNSNTVHRY